MHKVSLFFYMNFIKIHSHIRLYSLYTNSIAETDNASVSSMGIDDISESTMEVAQTPVAPRECDSPEDTSKIYYPKSKWILPFLHPYKIQCE